MCLALPIVTFLVTGNLRRAVRGSKIYLVIYREKVF